jgi:hypothetical protein
MTKRVTPVTGLELVRERVQQLYDDTQRLSEEHSHRDDLYTTVGFSAQAEVLHTVLAIIDEEARGDSDRRTKMCPEAQWCDIHQVFGVHEAWDVT